MRFFFFLYFVSLCLKAWFLRGELCPHVPTIAFRVSVAPVGLYLQST
jgi:hypothetical protein